MAAAALRLLRAVALLACAATAQCLASAEDEPTRLRDPRALKAHRLSLPHPPPHIPDPRGVVQLAWSPRAFLFPNFLSDAECDFIVNYSTPAMERSTVRKGKDGHEHHDIRTSYGTFLDKYSHPVLKRIEERVAAWTHLPVENQEAMQVLRYQHGQKYGSHHDYFEDEGTRRTGPRYATVLLYLTDVEMGGETVFPASERDKEPKDETWSDCGKQGVGVKARKGNALLFFSMRPDGSFDAASLHSGCPVIKGTKWSATKWIHSGAFDPPFRDPDLCVDDNKNCPSWAAQGECQNNPKFMVGSGREQYELGFCRKSCKVCV